METWKGWISQESRSYYNKKRSIRSSLIRLLKIWKSIFWRRAKILRRKLRSNWRRAKCLGRIWRGSWRDCRICSTHLLSKSISNKTNCCSMQQRLLDRRIQNGSSIRWLCSISSLISNSSSSATSLIQNWNESC